MKNPFKPEENPRYKWFVVGAAFLMVFVTLGFCSSTKGLFLDVVTKALEIPRSLYSINDSCRFITTAIVNLFFGALVQRFGARKMVAAGFVSLIGSMTVYSLAQNIYQFYIGGVLLGLGLSWTTTTMVGYLMEIWCKEHKGTIMGAVLAANGLGGAISVQIISGMIHGQADPFAYRNAYRVIALILLITGALVVLIIRNKATDQPYVKGHGKKRGQSWSGIAFADAAKSPVFYLLLGCIFCIGMALQSINGISSAHLRDVGFEDSYVDLVLSVHSLALAAAKFLSGVSYDRIGLKKTLMLCNGAAVIMSFLLAIAQVGPGGNVIAMAFGVLSSAALPLETIMLPLIASDLFGQKSYAKFLGIFVSVNTAGYALGVPLTNLCYDAVGSYKPVLFVLTGVAVAVMVCYQFIFRWSDRQRSLVEQRETNNAQ